MANLSSKWIKVSEPIPHVLHLELCRPPVNAFSTEFWKEYGAIFRKLCENEQDVRVVVVSSAFPKIFTAGLDLNSTATLTTKSSEDATRSAFTLQQHIKEFQQEMGIPEHCPFPVIAAVHGNVIGLGIDLISACDIRYAASNATFAIKEVDVGLAADIGTLSYLPKVTGNQSLARELAYTARTFSASEALSLGFVSKVVDGGKNQVVTEALALAEVIASKSPVAITGTKKIISHARDHSISESLDYTAIWNSAGLLTDDVKASIIAVKTKSKPKYLGIPKVKL